MFAQNNLHSIKLLHISANDFVYKLMYTWYCLHIFITLIHNLKSECERGRVYNNIFFTFQCVLSSIIVVALRSLLLQVLELPKVWRTSKYDFVSVVYVSSTSLLS